MAHTLSICVLSLRVTHLRYGKQERTLYSEYKYFSHTSLNFCLHHWATRLLQT